MLTHHDRTVENAIEIFEICKNSLAEFWGFKEVGLPLEDMKRLCAMMKAAGKTTFFEVVAYTEAECLEGAKMAAECGFVCLLGTLYFDSILAYAKEHGLRYMSFVGKIEGRPSVLHGTIEGMIDEAKGLLEKGVMALICWVTGLRKMLLNSIDGLPRRFRHRFAWWDQ